MSLKLFEAINNYAMPRGLLFADTKFELAKKMLVDEYGTPDSSRIWLYSAWRVANKLGVAPEGFDKQFIREWGKGVGIKKNPNLIPPPGVLIKTADLYLQATQLLCDKPLEQFQIEDMGITA
jgi:phosphoribosylaminoimidazole-succinocarboxamide synthase